MKSFFTILLATLATAVLGQQLEKVDTVYVSTNQSTYLVFPATIAFYDIGSEDFGADIQDNTLLIKAVSDKAQPASILVKYGSDFYHGTLVFKGKPKKNFIDLRKAAIPTLNEGRGKRVDSLSNFENNIAERRLHILLSDPKIYYYEIAIKQDKIIVSLTNIMRDDENVFLKLFFINGTKLDYNIDFLEFIYHDPVEIVKGASNLKNVNPIVTNKVDQIRAKQELYLGYCIPFFNQSKKGKLTVVVREKNGSRMITLDIPFSEILDCKSFSNK
jgi:hypothetical protein